MTLIEKYTRLSSLCSELLKILDKERRCIRSGGRLPIQDRERKERIEVQIKPLLLNVTEVKQGNLL